jgi:ParB/RepB/Spo0J family partition protein
MPKVNPMETTTATETTTAATTAPTLGELKTVSLKQLKLDPHTDVRSGTKAKDEEEKIDQLAKSIYETGQIQPLFVRPDSEPDTYLITAGRRRFLAFHRIWEKTNEERPILIVVKDQTDEEAWAASLQENLQRRQFSPIELAQNILDIKKRKGFDAEDWSKHVAEFLHVSRATVTQHARLLELKADVRNKVHKGDLSVQSALDLLDVKESKRDEVLAKAETLAEEEEAVAPAKGKGKEAKGKGKGKSGKDASEDEPEKGKVKRKHVLAAARESEALKQDKPRTRGEIVGFFQAILDAAPGNYPEAITDFASTFVNRYATGKVGERSLLNKLDVIAEFCEGGKKTKGKKVA